jgi:hypothetical protein
MESIFSAIPMGSEMLRLMASALTRVASIRHQHTPKDTNFQRGGNRGFWQTAGASRRSRHRFAAKPLPQPEPAIETEKSGARKEHIGRATGARAAPSQSRF